jgi:hypothetical protein
MALIRAGAAPRPLFDRRGREQSEILMDVIDAVNGRFVRGTIAPAAAGFRKQGEEV